MSEELKPCPFCGGEARIIAKPYEPKVCVGCDDDTCLGFSGLGWLYDSEKEATDAWNRRAERTCVFRYEEKLGEYACSSCGERVSGSNPADEYEVSPLAVLESFEYCPHCGARVIKEEL